MSRFVLVLLSATVLVACGDKEGPGLVDEDAGLDAGDVGDITDAGRDAVSVPDMRPPRMRPDLGECSPDRPDPPDEWYFDANCDGIDGDESNSVFVASYGVDDNPGTKALPKRTIRSAIATAVDEDKQWVLVGDGLHEAGFELADGVSIAGGYGFGWERSDRFRTSLEGGNPAISGSGIRSKTILTGFEVEPRAVARPRETVATILLVRSPGVRLRGLTIVGGVGGDGRDGADGVMGEEGDDGDDGDDGREDSGFIGCDEDGKPNVGAGGENGCEDARGGNGGEPGHENDGGMKGQDAAAGTAGGPPGADNEPGMKGDDGGRGSNGAPGTGGSADGGFFGWVWVGRDGEPGADGDPGTGGGGGGGGGGGSAMCDSWGGAGGGGGSGGCGGTGGGAGGYGGASVALFLYQSDVQIEGCTIIGGSGGRGGSGGDGGPGGRGGLGGSGGSREDDSGKGGDGGDGGVGGRGGQGGGGSGGPSYGVYSTDPLSVAPERIDFQVGAGGPGGLSASGDGRGADGVAQKKRIPSGGMMPAE